MNEVEFFFSGWWPLLRIVVVGTVLFLAVVLLLRVTENRTLSRLTTFDFIVTVAVGAVFGRALTARDLSLSEALLAILVLIFLQYLLSFLRARSGGFSKFITSPPVLLYHAGAVQRDAMRREHLTEEDLQTAVRTQGFHDLSEVDTLVLESTGTISVLGRKAQP